MRIRRPPLLAIVFLGIVLTNAAIFVPLFDGLPAYPSPPGSDDPDAVAAYASDDLAAQLGRKYESTQTGYDILNASATTVSVEGGTFARATVHLTVEGDPRTAHAYYFATDDRVVSAPIASGTGGAPAGYDRPADERVDAPASAVVLNFRNESLSGDVTLSGPGMGYGRDVHVSGRTGFVAGSLTVVPGVHRVSFHSSAGSAAVRVNVTAGSDERVGVVFFAPDGSVHAAALPRH